ncbi:MAG: menaquinone biosynthesis protein [Phycisphaeraceae bacterium]|nr:menaquinone biosynthesis protein [Phycisphaeraceae bacterium]MCB9846978.1 menaquinone biosynthesis protein [Phycisphaeraceae bacterium]
MSAPTHPSPSVVEPKPTPEGARARIGAVRYLNTRPMITGLEKCADLDLTLAAPAELFGMLEAGAVDVALAPVFEAQRPGPGVTLLPCGMIGSEGETLTVRLFSIRPIDTITTVWADTESRTSVALLRILLNRLHGVDVEVVPFNAHERMAHTAGGAPASAVEWPDAALLIGDKVVTDSAPAVRYPHQLDLGGAWRSLTGLPFVYAAWMRRTDRTDDPRVRRAAMALDRQRRHNAMRADWIADTQAPALGWPTDLARRYLGELLSYEPRAAHREAIETFFAMAHEQGLIEERRPVTWARDDEPCLA